MGSAEHTVTMLAFGSLGDVLPYAALVTGLESAGFHVRFVTHAVFEPSLRARGLNVASIDTDPRAALDTHAGRKLLASGPRPLAFGRGVARILAPVLESIAARVLKECRGADLIITSGLAGFIAPHIGEKLGIPCIPALLQPVTATGAFPNSFVSSRYWSNAGNRLSHFAYWRGTGALFKSSVNQMRRRVLGLPEIRRIEPHSPRPRGAPLLYGYSPSVLPKPSDWPESIHVTGYWFPSSLPDWRPPPELIAFLLDGPKPLCIGFGSMSNYQPQNAAASVVEALRLTRQRAILLTGWGGRCDIPLPENIFQLQFAPHDWLFSQTAAVVHHGGAGTTAAALRAGIPSIIVPFFADQYFWGRLLHRLGAGTVPIPRRRLNAPALAAAIDQVTREDRLLERASHFGARIWAENGVEKAVAAVTACLARDKERARA